RKGLTYGRRYTYVVLTGDRQGRIGPPSHRISVSYAAAPAESGNVVAEPGERSVRLKWDATTRLLDGNAVTDALRYEVLRAPSADDVERAVSHGSYRDAITADDGAARPDKNRRSKVVRDALP